MRTRPERGATAVEAALVTPVILMMIFGILEFGFYFKDALSASSAVKSGVRTASSEARISTFAQDTADTVQAQSGAMPRGTIKELWVYKANAGDNFPVGYSAFTGCTTCVRFSWNGSSFTPTYSNWASTTHDACADSPPDRIGVYLKADHPAFTRFVFSSLPITQSDVLRFEPVPSRVRCKP